MTQAQETTQASFAHVHCPNLTFKNFKIWEFYANIVKFEVKVMYKI